MTGKGGKRLTLKERAAAAQETRPTKPCRFGAALALLPDDERAEVIDLLYDLEISEPVVSEVLADIGISLSVPNVGRHRRGQGCVSCRAQGYR